MLLCSAGVSFNQVCYPCGINCALCINATCNACKTSYYLYNSNCFPSCPSNTLSLDGSTCVLCSQVYTNCSICNTTQCLSCNYGQLLNGVCKPCGAGTYTQSGACLSCPSLCSTCTSLTACQTCTSGNFLLGNSCASSCPLNTIPSGFTCSICTDKCSICNQTTSLCRVCNAGVYLYNNLCYSTCPGDLVVSYDFLTCQTKEAYYVQFSHAAKIIPFPFTIASLIMIIIGAIFKFYHREMHLQTMLCASISFV